MATLKPSNSMKSSSTVAGRCSPLVALPSPVSPLRASNWQKRKPLLLIPTRTFSTSLSTWSISSPQFYTLATAGKRSISGHRDRRRHHSNRRRLGGHQTRRPRCLPRTVDAACDSGVCHGNGSGGAQSR